MYLAGFKPTAVRGQKHGHYSSYKVAKIREAIYLKYESYMDLTCSVVAYYIKIDGFLHFNCNKKDI
jgi:hypothetical protein